MSETLTRPPAVDRRSDLIREVGFRLTDTTGATGSDGRTIDGYGAVFDTPTRIQSWEGDFEEDIRRGAFRKSIRERTPVMQYDHGRHPLIGSIPLGRWDIVEEDDAGLHVVGRLSDNWLMQPVRDAIAGPEGKGGGITGMSFRFSVVSDQWVDKDGKRIKPEELDDLLWFGAGERGPLRRTLTEVKVSEVGPVAWPAYEATSVGVRSAESPFVIDLGRIDLRTEGGRGMLARAVALADRAAPQAPDVREQLSPPAVDTADRTDSAAVDTGAGSAEGVDTATIRDQEPQTTAQDAATHSTEPGSTGSAAGEHSSETPPTRRRSRADIVARIRENTRAITRASTTDA